MFLCVNCDGPLAGPSAVPRGPDTAWHGWTHEARHDEPYLLYLVRTRKWQKFGVGDEGRVKEHLRGGAEVVQVMRAPFAQVVLAEKLLKQQHCADTIRRVKRGMIASFGQGTEVTRRAVRVTLSQVLPADEDVTHWFS